MPTHLQGAQEPSVEATSKPTSAPPGVPFIEAGPNPCRWPLRETEADPRLVCGAPRVPGSSDARRTGRCGRWVNHAEAPLNAVEALVHMVEADRDFGDVVPEAGDAGLEIADARGERVPYAPGGGFPLHCVDHTFQCVNQLLDVALAGLLRCCGIMGVR